MKIIDKITSNFSKIILYLAFIPLLLLIMVQTASILKWSGSIEGWTVKIICYINLSLYIASSILIFIGERKSEQTTINVTYRLGLSSWIFCLIVVLYVIGAYNKAVERSVYILFSPLASYVLEPNLIVALFLITINMQEPPILLSIILGLNAALGIICIIFGSLFRRQTLRKI